MQKLALLLLVGSVAAGAMMPTMRSAAPDPPPGPVEAGPVEQQVIMVDGESAHLDLGTGAITINRSPDGHFYAEAQVNGEPINFLIDTGASTIALSRDDARRAAISLNDTDQVVGSGASGEVLGQFVELDRVSLGLKEARRVNAIVLQGGTQSLLGQSFLSQFGSMSVEGDTMVLR